MGIWHPLWFPKVIIDNVSAEGNDGLVTVSSAKWGEFLGVVDNCDHWDIRGAGGLNRLNLNIGNSLGEVINLGKVMSWTEWRSKESEKKEYPLKPSQNEKNGDR